MHYVIALGVFIGLVLSACASSPGPEPASQADTGSLRTASELEGIRVSVRVDAWNGEPRNLETRAAPVLVDIENRSDRPLRLAFEDFQLIRAAAGSFTALPVESIRGTLARPVARFGTLASGDPVVGSAIVASRTPSGANRADRLGPLGYDPLHFHRVHGTLQHVTLPTEEMRRQALPMGVLEPAATRSGFLYFEPLGYEVMQAVLQMELVDAGTQKRFGTIRTPFRLSRRD